MKCPNCDEELSITKYSYRCSKCGLKINKTVSGTLITETIIDQLKDGQTGLLDFVSKSGKPFKARLKIEDNKLAFIFLKKQVNDAVIRVDSSTPGNVLMSIKGPIEYSVTVSFGLLPSKLSECLGVISALKILKHYKYNQHVSISAGTKEFVQYVLKEVTPSKKEARGMVEELHRQLNDFKTWDIIYHREKKPVLQGGVQYMTFPAGLFPWVEIKCRKNADIIHITLPDCPAVKAQITASINSIQEQNDGSYTIPAISEKAFKAWLNKTKNGGEILG